MPSAWLEVSPASLPRLLIPPSFVQMKARGLKSMPTTYGGFENPTTSPCSLMSIGVCQKSPPRSPMSVGTPLFHITEWRALRWPTAMSQSPEMPTTWPFELIAVAAVVESPGSGGSSRFVLFSGSHNTARNWSTCGALQVGSCTGVSAQPTTWPRLLTLVAKPCSPPSVGSAVITPFSQKNPRQILPVTLGRNAVQLHSSCSVSSSAVSAKPAISTEFERPGHCTTLLGPPRVPRVSSTPSCQ